MKNPPLLFLDTETLGLDIAAPIWEVAAVRLDGYGNTVDRMDALVAHEAGDHWLDDLPTRFADDYRERFDPKKANTPAQVIRHLIMLADGATVCGSNPSFDIQRLEKLAHDTGFHPDALKWHYHPLDVPTLVHGYLAGKGVYPAPPWKSDLLSQMVGVDPGSFDRHTAMGDVLWTLAMWRAVMGK